MLILAAGLAACWEPDVGPVAYETGHPVIDMLEPDVGPVLGEPDEVFRVDGWYWTRYRGEWFHSLDAYVWRKVPPDELPAEIARLPSGPYGRWREGRWHRWESWDEVPATPPSPRGSRGTD